MPGRAVLAVVVALARVAPSASLAPVGTRRAFAKGAAAAAAVAAAGTALPRRAGAEDATFVRAAYGGAGTVVMPSTWLRDGAAIREAVLGPITDSARATAAPTALTSIADMGRVGADNAQLGRLGLAGRRADGDVVAARTRTDAAGRVYYEWDLAVPPPGGRCPRADQDVIVCPPAEVALVSATVADGALLVFEVGADRAQWKNFAAQLRAMRSSFSPGV